MSCPNTFEYYRNLGYVRRDEILCEMNSNSYIHNTIREYGKGAECIKELEDLATATIQILGGQPEAFPLATYNIVFGTNYDKYYCKNHCFCAQSARDCSLHCERCYFTLLKIKNYSFPPAEQVDEYVAEENIKVLKVKDDVCKGHFHSSLDFANVLSKMYNLSKVELAQKMKAMDSEKYYR